MTSNWQTGFNRRSERLTNQLQQDSLWQKYSPEALDSNSVFVALSKYEQAKMCDKF